VQTVQVIIASFLRYSAPYYIGENPDGTCTVLGITPAPVGAFILPAVIDQFPVSALDYYAFQYCESMTSVTIPSGVISIPDGVFAFCTNITAININSNNPAYTSVDGVLFNKDETELVACPAGNPVDHYTAPDTISNIAPEAFEFCRNLIDVTFLGTITEIPNFCFAGCNHLSDFVIPDNVTSIGINAFDDSGLTNVTIPDSVTTIEYLAFNSCYNLTNIALGAGVTTIGNTAFQDSGLMSITIPNTVTSIGNQVFWYSSNLATAEIGSGVTNIGDEVFTYCTGLAEITVDSNNPAYSSKDGVLLDKSQTRLMQYPLGSRAASYAFPNTVGTIDSWAFAASGSLGNVSFDDALTNIGDYAFLSCPNLASAAIPANVVSLGYQAFSGAALTNAVIEGGNIGSEAFLLCNDLVTVSFGPGVAGFGFGAFASCPALKALYFQGNAPALGAEAFVGVNATVYYLAGTSGWSDSYGGLPAIALNGVTFTATPTNGGAPLTVTFTAPSSDSAGNAITNWQWQFGDGSGSSASNPTHVYAAGTYYPQLLASNCLGLPVLGAALVSINVSPAPGLGVVNFLGSNLVIAVSNATPGTAYRLLASSNLALPLSQWTSAATNISSTTDNFTLTLTNALDGSAPSQFYILKSP
jgi:hypothetical protein